MKSTKVDGVETYLKKVSEEKAPFGIRVITIKKERHLDGKEYFSLIKIAEPTEDGRTLIAYETRLLCCGVESIKKSCGLEPEPEAGCCVIFESD